MDSVQLFPFADYWPFYGVFTLFVLGVLALDLGVFHRKAHVVSLSEAAVWTVVWCSLALAFNYGLYRYSLSQFASDPRLLAVPGFDAAVAARDTALEFLSGYLVEWSLSVDNIFVFVVVFNYFAIPRQYQHRVLFYGILGALVFRAIFIGLGAFLMQFSWVPWVFGGFLLLTGLKILFAPDKPLEPGKNPLLRLMRRVLPVAPAIDGPRFFVRPAGVLHATPLLVCLVFVELTDIIFAIDSVPAIFALTSEPLVVFTSNIFAILGLRALFFLLAGVMHLFRFLKHGLGLVLIFVGLKMVWLNPLYGGHFPVLWSLGIIAGILSAAIAASLLFRPAALSGPPPHP